MVSLYSAGIHVLIQSREKLFMWLGRPNETNDRTRIVIEHGTAAKHTIDDNNNKTLNENEE